MNWILQQVFVLGLCLSLGAWASAAAAVNKLAFVVGIDTYQNVISLEKATNDANAVSETLAQLGFGVSTVIDPDRRTFNREMSRFAANILPGDEVVFFFAGHGIQVAGRNYLLPADVPAAKAGDEPFIVGESISVQRIMDIFRGQGARITMLILDACRNNPFEVDGNRAIGGARGLAAMSAPEGSFVLFSAGTGQLALDRLTQSDPNPNSVFTRELLPLLAQENLTTRDLASKVRSRVKALAATVGHSQFPAYDDQIDGDYSLNPTTTLAGLTPRTSEGVDTTQSQKDDRPCGPGGCLAETCKGLRTQIRFDEGNRRAFDLEGLGANLSFGTAGAICVDGDEILIETDTLTKVQCQNILNSPSQGLGHDFVHNGQDHYFWFFIDPADTPRALEIGVYLDTTPSTQLAWIETGVALCN